MFFYKYNYIQITYIFFLLLCILEITLLKKNLKIDLIQCEFVKYCLCIHKKNQLHLM